MTINKTIELVREVFANGVAPGDSVLIHKTKAGDGKKIKLEDEEYHLVHESELSMVSSK